LKSFNLFAFRKKTLEKQHFKSSLTSSSANPSSGNENRVFGLTITQREDEVLYARKQEVYS